LPDPYVTSCALPVEGKISDGTIDQFPRYGKMGKSCKTVYRVMQACGLMMS